MHVSTIFHGSFCDTPVYLPSIYLLIIFQVLLEFSSPPFVSTSFYRCVIKLKLDTSVFKYFASPD